MKTFICCKRFVCTLLFLFCIAGISVAEEAEQDDDWQGMIRLNPADLLINLHNALPGVSVTWVPSYVLPNLGIPVEADVNVGWGVLPGVEVSLLSGLEYIPVGPTGKHINGLFLDGKIGLSLFFNEGVKAAFAAKVHVGYQIVTRIGVVTTPAVGVVYNGRSGLGLHIMLDFGFAYK